MAGAAEEGLLDRPLRGRIGAGTREAPRLVVEIWLAAGRPGRWRLLMLRRTPARGGFWQGVSGRVDASDATLRAAALREIAEETGWRIGPDLWDLGRWTEFDGLVSKRRFRKRSLLAVLPAQTDGASPVLSEEHDAARWMTFDEARAHARFPAYVREIDAIEAHLEGPDDP